MTRPRGDAAAGPLAIRAEGLGRDYGTTRALIALDLQISAGALVGLLGPNGAGKTTAMLLLATLLAPSRGQAHGSFSPHDLMAPACMTGVASLRRCALMT